MTDQLYNIDAKTGKFEPIITLRDLLAVHAPPMPKLGEGWEVMTATEILIRKGEVTRYSWPYHYADMVLAEREAGNG